MARVNLSNKHLSRARVKEKIEQERRAGRKIVFTNGCFDLLHVGHVRYLSEARQKGDLLVVGVNTDDTVRDLKGPGRPILPLDERMRILAALESVSYVVAFGEPTPYELIGEVRPDVLVKGGDYEINQIVGRDIVWADGGEVCTIPLTEAVSTSKIVKKIRSGRENPGTPAGE